MIYFLFFMDALINSIHLLMQTLMNHNELFYTFQKEVS
jgi:hypothetical protein